MEIEPIIQLAKAFRNAIVSVPKNEFETGLGCTNFPHACCDDASLLLHFLLTTDMRVAIEFTAFMVEVKKSCELMYGSRFLV
ncbi:MAG: hypothetical protein ACTILI_16760 [Halomonas sp.]|uniref:hypothetical protein n=1 Tax=Halomonas sp. TaxID=1486246 RepID=UPI003F98B4CF